VKGANKMKKIIYYLAVLIIISTQSIFSQLEFIQLQRIPEEHKIFRLLNSIVADIKTAKINLGDYTVLLTGSSKWSFSKTNKKDGGENNITQLFENITFSDIEIIPISTVIKSDIAEVSFNIIVTAEFGYMEESLILYFVKESERWVLNDDDSSQRFLYCLEKNYIPVPTESITTFTIFESNKTLIPYKIYNDPDIWDLNKNVTWNYFGKWLFANNSEIDMDVHCYSNDWPNESAVFYLDPYWQRIVYTKYNSTDIKAFNLEFYPGAEYPSEPWGITTDDWGNIYVSDKRNDCLVKLVYVPSANSMYFSGKFTIPELDGPTDVIYSSHDTPNNSTDDYFLIANKNAKNIIKTDINGNVLNSITQFKTGGSYYNFISPVRITQVPNSTYIAILDNALNYVIVGYHDGANTLLCHNVINFGGYLNPTDVGTNCYGDILVSDENNQIHKFNIIGEYLCTYISNAFHFPLRFSRVNDLEYYIFDQNCADRWSPDHGIKRFIPGSDAFKLAYNQSSTNHLFYYTLSDYSQVKLEIINSNNQVIFTKNCGGRISGRRTETVSMNEIPIGNYTYRINYKPLHDELYGSYQQGWRYTQIPISVQLKATISGPTVGTPGATSNFTAVTNAQNATYQWEQLYPCCGDDYNCGLYFYRGNGSTLSILNSMYHYYLRLTVWDGLNNSAWDFHYVTVETCAGGGGGNGCPTLAFESDSLSDSGMEDENSVLIASTAHPTEDIVDYYLIQSEISPVHGEFNFTIHEPKTEHTWLDQVGFIEVELNEDELLAVTDNGEIVNYLEQHQPLTIMLNNSLDVSEMLSLADGDTLNLEPGDILSIGISAATGDANNFIVTEGFVFAKNITADIMFLPVGSEEEDLGDIFLRPNVSVASINLGSLEEGTLQIEFHQYSTLDYLTLVNDLNTADIEVLEMASAEHSESGSVLELLVNDPDQQYSEIYPGQEISFIFREGVHTKTKIQYILKTVGRYEIDTTDAFNKLTKNSEEVVIPKENKLFENYPNPFNPTTQIKYSVKENGFVNLKVYDVLGNEVSSLVNEEKQAGSYTVTFDAGRLASGIYFYTISANNFHQTKKMLLIK
jgi:hypothetical protein